VVAVNVADEARALAVPIGDLPAPGVAPAVLFGDGCQAAVDGTTLRITLPPRSGAVIDVVA